MDMGEEMSKEKHLLSTTLVELEVEQLSKRVERLENTIKEFMENWGPETQKRRDERDAVWDEMVRVVSIQKRSEDE